MRVVEEEVAAAVNESELNWPRSELQETSLDCGVWVWVWVSLFVLLCLLFSISMVAPFTIAVRSQRVYVGRHNRSATAMHVQRIYKMS